MQILNALVTLAGHLAWPVAALAIIVVLRRELKKILGSLTERIADPASSLTIGKGGLEIKGRVDAALGRIESLETDQNQSKELILGVLAKNESATPVRSDGQATVPPEIFELADAYMNVAVKDWSERVRTKDELARKMANLVLTRHVSKDLLAAQDQEGVLMALVTAIHTAPEKGDFDRLAMAARKVTRLHVKYRIVMALGRIFEQNLATKDDISRANQMLDQFESGADAALRRRIIQTRASIDLAVNRLPSSA